MKAEISSIPAYIYTTKYDLQNIESIAKSENKIADVKNPQQIKAITYKLSMQSTLPDIKSTQSLNNTMDKVKDDEFKINLQDTKAKAYDEVLDIYSLHQFIIRRGKTLIETPEFISYKRKYFGVWPSIEKVIIELEKLLGQYDIKIAYIDGKKIAALAEITDIKPTIQQLVGCVMNQEELKKFVNIPQKKQPLFGPNAEDMAATRIQAYWRMFRCMRAYKRIQMLLKRVSTIQKAAKNFLRYKKTLGMIRERKEGYYLKYKTLNEEFKKEWPEIKKKRRVEIHIASLAYDVFFNFLEVYHYKNIL